MAEALRFLSKTDCRQREWLVDSLIGDRDTVSLSALPSTGKSALTLNLACHIASGEHWFGRAVKQGAVLIIAGERAEDTTRRLHAYSEHQGSPTEEIFVADAVMKVDLHSREGVEIVLRTIDKAKEASSLPLRMIILDTFRSLVRGVDERSQKEMSEFARNVAMIRDYADCAVLVVHHSPASKPGQSAGSNALGAVMEVEIGLTKKRGNLLHWQVMSANNLSDRPEASFCLVSVGPPLDSYPSVAPRANADTRTDTARLPGDAIIMLEAARSVAVAGVASRKRAQLAAKELYPDYPYQRQRSSKGWKALSDEGLISVDGDNITFSDAS